MAWFCRLVGIILPPTLALLFSQAAPAGPASQESKAKDRERPSLSLRASPVISFTPAKIFLTAELKGGADDYKEFYCAAVEWDWDDGTTSESQSDCEPHEAGKSKIQRRFSIQHVYKVEGSYRVYIRLMQKGKCVVAANTSIQVNPGIDRSPL
jgi:hypothetical protein